MKNEFGIDIVTLAFCEKYERLERILQMRHGVRVKKQARAARALSAYQRGMITTDEALKAIAQA